MSDSLTNNPPRPQFPLRAVVTAGMPYGNKGLHFGHIGGVFIPADVFARFLRDRIGAQNVLFISGTDCYGSPIDEGYRKLVEANEFSGSIEDYVERNHQAQFDSLQAHDISLDIYEGSGLGSARAYHLALTREIFQRLYQHG
ncbi:MAG: class I tRNA ligase family protein, partial [Coriobacteriales bacterium]|nr:class I tRNA ligase family protein [Coriobacteriales bacterium]